MYLLSLTDLEHRWVALLAGFVAVAVLIRLPLVGGLLNLIVLVLGLGGITEVLYRRYRGETPGKQEEQPGGGEGDTVV